MAEIGFNVFNEKGSAAKENNSQQTSVSNIPKEVFDEIENHVKAKEEYQCMINRLNKYEITKNIIIGACILIGLISAFIFTYKLGEYNGAVKQAETGNFVVLKNAWEVQ